MKSRTIHAKIKHSLSTARLSTYESVTSDLAKAIELYRWNLAVSAAFLECLSVCEVVVRNAVSEAIQAAHGESWVTDSTFQGRLPKNAKQTLQKAVCKSRTVDKTIPELPFVFWQSMFTSRFDADIWNKQLNTIMPNAENKNVAQLRREIYEDLDTLRQLRNRIAHHEPIFNRDLEADHQRLHKIIAYRSFEVSGWVAGWQRINKLLQSRGW